jgi:hypothetical protein
MGLISGCITQSLTCPIKTVAIRIGSGVTGENSMGEAASNIYKEGGVGGFLYANFLLAVHCHWGLYSQHYGLYQNLTALNSTTTLPAQQWMHAAAMHWFALLLLYSAGNLTGLISQPGTIALSFYFFERFRYLGNRILPGADQLIALLGGGLAQSAAVVITYPARAAKDKLQGQREGMYTGLTDVLRKSCAYY